MKKQLEAILENARIELKQTKTARELDAVRVKFLGKKGELELTKNDSFGIIKIKFGG